jgi:hypothetical protein
MVELEPVAHLRSQLAAFHMPLPCVKQKSVAERVVVLRQHRSDFEVPLRTVLQYRSKAVVPVGYRAALRWCTLRIGRSYKQTLGVPKNSRSDRNSRSEELNIQKYSNIDTEHNCGFQAIQHRKP